MINSKKNIIIISIDNLRSDCIGQKKEVYRKYKLKNKLSTPVLDSLANQGVFFENCYTTAPYTTNAHASILTGCWPYNHGIIDFISRKLERPTVLQILKNQGYSTLFQADYHFLLGQNLGFDQGVDKYVKENEAESFQWIKQNAEKPLACFFHFANVHAPYGFFNLAKSGAFYRKKVAKLLKKYQIEPDQVSQPGKHFITSELAGEDLILKQNYQKVLDKLSAAGDYSAIMDLYIEGINFFEKRRFKDFIENLKNIGIFQNSVIVLMGDHGEVWDENNQGHAKGNLIDALTDDVLRVPLIFYGLEKITNRLQSSNIRTIDIVPTILSLAGIETENSFDGVSLFGQKIKSDLNCFSHICEADSAQVTLYMNELKEDAQKKPKFNIFLKSATLKKGAYRLTQNYDNLGKVVTEILINFKGEVINSQKIRFEYRKELLSYNKRTKAKIGSFDYGQPAADKDDLRRQLRSLGYKV
jgi:membrane-anchored protein YejM (alkaline phosphatase superfamily)